MNSEPHPPEAPEIPRRIILPPKRIAGVGFLLLFPILAIAGILGNHETSATRTSGTLQIDVEYPDRLRYFTEEPLDVTIHNASTAPTKEVHVRVDREYLLGFTDESFVPDPDRVNQKTVEFDLGPIPPGETRCVQIELTAQRYGSRTGQVQVEAGEARADFQIRTLVLP